MLFEFETMICLFLVFTQKRIIMATPTAVNDQITDSVTQSNVSVVASALRFCFSNQDER